MVDLLWITLFTLICFVPFILLFYVGLKVVENDKEDEELRKKLNEELQHFDYPPHI